MASTKHIREALGGLTQKEFAEKYGIPYRTVTSWDYRQNMPEWVETMLGVNNEDETKEEKEKQK